LKSESIFKAQIIFLVLEFDQIHPNSQITSRSLGKNAKMGASILFGQNELLNFCLTGPGMMGHEMVPLIQNRLFNHVEISVQGL